MEATISYRQQMHWETLDGPNTYQWLFSIIGLICLCGVASFPDFPILWPCKVVALFLFRSMLVIRAVAVVSVSLHVGEAIYAWRLAKRIDPRNARGWFWQTLALGFFSLQFLLKKKCS